MRHRPLLVGRRQELELLRDALASPPVIVRISGEAGIGKSRLAREAIAMARERGFAVFEAACFPDDAAVAYAPFRELHAAFVSEAQPSSAEPGERHREVVAAWRQWLESSAGERSLCLCIEDLHWCDEVSLALLADLALRRLAVPCSVVVTFRDEESPVLAAWRAAVDRSRSIVDIALSPLANDECQALVHGLFASAVPPADAVVRELCELAEGNPFYLEELVKAAGPDAAPGRLPRSIRDAIRSRLDRLGAETRELVVLAAVIGRDFDASFLGRVLALDEHSLSRHLHALVDASFVVERDAERFSFRHALLRVAVLDGLLVRERRELHRRIARALVDGGSSDVEALARHWAGAESWDEAIPASLAAAEAAFALHAFRAAKDHWTVALEAASHRGRELPSDVHRSLGLACELLEEFDAATAAYRASLASAERRGDTLSEWQAYVALGRLWTRRDYTAAGAFFERARDTASRLAEPLVQAQSANAMGSWLLNIGRDAEAVAMHESALPLLVEDSHEYARAQTYDRLGMANGLAGRSAACVAAYDRAATLWRSLEEPRALATSLQGRAAFGSPLLAETVAWSGRSSEDCLADAMESVRIAVRVQVPSLEAFGRMGLACAHAARDEIGPALAEADACHAIARSAGHDEWSVGGRFIRALAFLRCLAAEEARDELRSLLPDAERTGSAWWSCNTRAYLALACIQCHDVAGAREALDGRGALLGSAAERRFEWARAELALLRRDGTTTRAIVDALQATRPDDPRAPVPLLLFLRGAGFVLDRRHASAIEVLERARDAVAATGNRALTLRIHAALATAFTATKRVDEAAHANRCMTQVSSELRVRAAEVGRAAACRAGIDRVLAPPGRVALRKQEADRVAGLTRREREVAALIGKGATNADIAKALHLSPRTVETHVEHILSKLQARSRVEIAVWVARTKDP